MAIIGISSVEGKVETYKAVTLKLFNGKKIVYDSGDFIQDWYKMTFESVMKYVDEPFTSLSSSVDHFIMDGAPYDSAYLRTVDDIPELFYDNNAHIDGLEFFVPEGTKPTWKEYKNKYHELCGLN